jgi:23S rRNA pseudouridine1911/1915/1917 synthase
MSRKKRPTKRRSSTPQITRQEPAPPQPEALVPVDGEIVVSEEWAGRRLDAIAKAAFSLSWGKTRDYIARGKFFVDGALCTEEGTEPVAGTKIVLRVEAPRVTAPNRIGPQQIVYEDLHVIVVRKPSGLLSVPYNDDIDTLDRYLRRYLNQRTKKKASSKGKNKASLYVVHRLDRATSGLMVFAKSVAGREGLSEQFKEHSMLREYRALVHGEVEDSTYHSHLLANRGDGIRGSRERSPNPHLRGGKMGKPSTTHVKLLEALGDASLVACRLETGRTHQIRIHLSEAGHPLVGETLYMRDFDGKELKAPRLMLHAATLGFVHPVTNEQLFFEEPLPSEMADFVARLRQNKES